MTKPKKLIEVAMPIKEISAESVRDKSIRHGHISTLHLWWARRPLPVCRAVVFASLVPDPLDPNCPDAFKEAIELLLGKKNNSGDPYATYSDIPWTSVFDPMKTTCATACKCSLANLLSLCKTIYWEKQPNRLQEKCLRMKA